MDAVKGAFLVVLLCLVGGTEASTKEQTFTWSEVAIFVAGCAAIMVLVVGLSFLIYEHSCRDYFQEPAARYYIERGDLQVVNTGETTRL